MIACIWRVTQHHQDAQDTMQDALGTIWRKRVRIVAHPNPEALILRICRGKAIDSLRRSVRRAEHERPPSGALCEQGDPVSPDREMQSREAMARIRQLVSTLPKKQAQAVLMRLVEEQSYSDIAVGLACSEATARSHVRRGRAYLRKALQSCRQGGTA